MSLEQNMDFKIKVLPRAKFELDEALSWYASRNLELGNELLNEINLVFDHLLLDPFLFRKTKKDFRQVPLKRFPYIIIYRIVANRVLIQSVFNTHQNPTKKP